MLLTQLFILLGRQSNKPNFNAIASFRDVFLCEEIGDRQLINYVFVAVSANCFEESDALKLLSFCSSELKRHDTSESNSI